MFSPLKIGSIISLSIFIIYLAYSWKDSHSGDGFMPGFGSFFLFFPILTVCTLVLLISSIIHEKTSKSKTNINKIPYGLLAIAIILFLILVRILFGYWLWDVFIK